MSARRAVAAVVLALALPAAGRAQEDSHRLDEGAKLYAVSCVSCHGPEGRGVSPSAQARGPEADRAFGPPLRGVGALAPDLYLRTGYMPLEDPYDQPRRGRPRFSDRQIDALVAYVASLGRGPPVPRPHPERGNVAVGLRLFTTNCSGCHQVVGAGGVVTDLVAPPLDQASDVQIAEAVRIGPYAMPRFSRARLSDADLDSIIRYVEYAKDPDDRGGWALGHVGPVPEGIVAWLLAGAALVAVTSVIGRRAG